MRLRPGPTFGTTFRPRPWPAGRRAWVTRLVPRKVVSGRAEKMGSQLQLERLGAADRNTFPGLRGCAVLPLRGASVDMPGKQSYLPNVSDALARRACPPFCLFLVRSQILCFARSRVPSLATFRRPRARGAATRGLLRARLLAALSLRRSPLLRPRRPVTPATHGERNGAARSRPVNSAPLFRKL